MIVSDNTLLCHFFLQSELSELAREVRARDGDWIVPALWRSEFANVLVKAYWACPDPLERYVQTWDSACSAMERCEREVDFHEVIRLGATMRISAYDAQYVHLAQKLGVILVTEDVKLQRAFPELAFSMRKFLQTNGGAMVRERKAAYRAGRETVSRRA